MHDQLATAYNLHRKNRKLKRELSPSAGDGRPMYAEGASVEDPKKMSGLYTTDANENQKGVNPVTYKGPSGGISEAGARLRTANQYGGDMKSSKDVAMNDVKSMHKKHLSKLQSMTKPNLYAEGGDVKGVHKNAEYDENGDRIGKYAAEKQMSQAGVQTRAASRIDSNYNPTSGMQPNVGQMRDENKKSSLHDAAKSNHLKVLNEMQSMKKPKLYGYGGMLESDDAGEMGLPMMEQENDMDEYSKHGIINYARGGMMEMPSPANQRLGSEKGLNVSVSHYGMGDGMDEQDDFMDEESPSLADSIRRKMMAKGGPIDENAIEHVNAMDDLNYDLSDDEMYSEGDALDDVESADHANRGSMGMSDVDMDADDDQGDHYDMVNAIRKKYARR